MYQIISLKIDENLTIQKLYLHKQDEIKCPN